jgi:hypothetical protein
LLSGIIWAPTGFGMVIVTDLFLFLKGIFDCPLDGAEYARKKFVSKWLIHVTIFNEPTPFPLKGHETFFLQKSKKKCKKHINVSIPLKRESNGGFFKRILQI